MKFLLAAALAGCLLRLAFSFGYWTDRPLTRDEQEYLALARSLTDGRGFTYGDAFAGQAFLPFSRAPGYPVFIAAVGAGRAPATAVPEALQAAQAIAGAAGVFLAGVLSYRLFGARPARLVAVLAAIYPPLVWISGYAMSEAVVWPMALACVLLYDRAWSSQDRSTRLAFICGLACGGTILVRSSLLLFVPLAASALAGRRRLAAAVALVVGAIGVIGPWTLRNYETYGRLIPVAADGGITFWTGNNALAIGEGDLAANPDIKRAQLELQARHPGLTQEQMEPVYYREALNWMTAHPGRVVLLELQKLFYTVVPAGPSYRLHSARYFFASVFSYAAIVILAAAGAWVRPWRLMEAPGLLWLTLSSVLVCLVFFPQERFRIPVIDPALVILASRAAHWRRRRS